MKYLALIASEEPTEEVDPEVWQQVMDAYNAFGEAGGQAGVLVGGEALEPSSTATTVRVRDGETLLTDGPFAETKEVIGGYYILDCPDLDTAVHWAAQIPGAKTGSVEVRPIMEFS
jgi:hypothetical protein